MPKAKHTHIRITRNTAVSGHHVAKKDVLRIGSDVSESSARYLVQIRKAVYTDAPKPVLPDFSGPNPLDPEDDGDEE